MDLLPLPKESESQAFGHLAVHAFDAQRPTHWRLTDLSGDSDAGLDKQVQVVTRQQYSHLFHVQIKGSTSTQASANGTFFSVALKVSTAHYLYRQSTPIMLAFVDFAADRNPLSAPICYLWIHQELKERLDALSQSVSRDCELTFRVPAHQRLTAALDVVPDLDAELQKREAMAGLQNALRATDSGISTVTALDRIASNVTSHGALYLDATLAPSEFPLPDAEPGSNAWHVRQLYDALGRSDVADAERIAARIRNLTPRDASERAEIDFQLGRLASLRGEWPEAAARFVAACEALPRNSRYWCALVETRLNVEDPVIVAQEALTSGAMKSLADEPRAQAMRARLLTIVNEFDQAERVLQAIPERVGIMERVLLASLRDQPRQAMTLADRAANLEIPRHTLLATRILAARSLAFDTLDLKPLQTMALSGPPGLKVAQLGECWEYVRAVAMDLQSASWPINSELLVEALTCFAMATGRAGEALPLVDGFLTQRPHFRAPSGISTGVSCRLGSPRHRTRCRLAAA